MAQIQSPVLHFPSHVHKFSVPQLAHRKQLSGISELIDVVNLEQYLAENKHSSYYRYYYCYCYYY